MDIQKRNSLYILIKDLEWYYGFDAQIINEQPDFLEVRFDDGRALTLNNNSKYSEIKKGC